MGAASDSGTTLIQVEHASALAGQIVEVIVKDNQPTVRVRDGLASILSVALAALFLTTGIGKVIGYSEMVSDFARWGYPDWLVIVAAALEVTGALLILLPRLATVGAGLLAISMCGAFATHVLNAQPGKAVLTLTLLCLVALVAVARWPRSILRTGTTRDHASARSAEGMRPAASGMPG